MSCHVRIVANLMASLQKKLKLEIEKNLLIVVFVNQSLCLETQPKSYIPGQKVEGSNHWDFFLLPVVFKDEFLQYSHLPNLLWMTVCRCTWKAMCGVFLTLFVFLFFRKSNHIVAREYWTAASLHLRVFATIVAWLLINPPLPRGSELI